MNKTTQIKDHLKKYDTISPLEAMSNYSVWRLAAEIHRLRQRGLNITTLMKRAPNGAKYAEYQLER
jgi:hypothetical protein